jgi:alcohol dehydrogenase class IV
MNLFGAMRLPRTVVFGSGHRASLGGMAAQIGNRALLCTDPRLSSDPHFKSVLADLSRSGLAVHVYDRTQPDLPLESVYDCLQDCASFGAQLVIGMGGGSCMDMAKAVALLLRHGGRAQDYYGEYKVPGPVLPVIAIPTTAGTGSEVTPVAVVSDRERNLKVGIASPHLIPIAAVCDPELTLSCPPALTAYSAGDALTHAIESYTALARTPEPGLTQQHVFVGKNALSDQFALLSISSIWKGLRRAYANGQDLEAREHLMLGALAAGCAFGTAGTAAAHAIQYPVGSLTHTAHGAGVATLLPYVMQFNKPACEQSFLQIARVLNLTDAGATDESLTQVLIEEIAALLDSVGIPRTLRDLGLEEDKQDYAAESALAITRLIKNNPRPLDLPAMRKITHAAFSGDRLSLRGI